MKPITLARIAILGAAAFALAGCGGGSGGSSGQTTTPLRLVDNFGTQFGVDFRNSPNTPATKPAAGDIIPLTLTAPPMPLH